jgi:integrase
MRLLLGFAADRTAKQPSELEVDDLDAPLIGFFLDHLEAERGNAVRTRNARLVAIRSLFHFAALRHPEHAGAIERVLAIPPKRFQGNLVTFLTEAEVRALLAAPDRSTWTGRRDRALLLLAAQTGLRASELTGLTCADVRLGRGPHVDCVGKGRKQRITPLTSATVKVLGVWLDERGRQGEEPLFPTRTGAALSRDALERRIATHVASAAGACRRWQRRR